MHEPARALPHNSEREGQRQHQTLLAWSDPGDIFKKITGSAIAAVRRVVDAEEVGIESCLRLCGTSIVVTWQLASNQCSLRVPLFSLFGEITLSKYDDASGE